MVPVVPAFETYVAADSSAAAAAAASSLKVAEQLSRNSKKHLVRHVAKGTAGPFAFKRFPMVSFGGVLLLGGGSGTGGL